MNLKNVKETREKVEGIIKNRTKCTKKRKKS